MPALPLEEEGHTDPDRLGQVKPAILIALLTLAAPVATGADPSRNEAAAAQREELERRASVEQKLKLADQMLSRSAGARRVAASGNEEARRLLDEARATFSAARAALDAGNPGAADDLAAESLRKVGLAVRLVPEQEEGELLRMRYVRILNAVQAFQASHYLISGGAGSPRPPEMERVRELVGRAQTLEEKPDYAEALRAIEQAADLVLESAPGLMAMRGASASGAAGLAAVNARYQGYEDLLAVAALRGGIAPEPRGRLQAAVERARSLNIRAQDLALSQRYDEAITASQDAIAVLREALQAVSDISPK
jgi:tetratricopeptide (TPR) repeat protein